jgi:hypothetical protein
MALFGRKASRMEEATLQKRPTEAVLRAEEADLALKSNPIAYQTGS